MALQTTFAEIDLKALSHNLAVVRRKAPRSTILAVVKADAYGHGAVDISKHLVSGGVRFLGVAFLDEAVKLRTAGITVPILVFFDSADTGAFFVHDLRPVVFDIDSAKRFSREASRRGRVLPVHVEVDTGMGRTGFTMDKAFDNILRVSRMKNLRLEGIMSHFSEADLKDKRFADLQLNRFLALRKELRKKRIVFRYSHISNSSGVLSMPDAHLTMVRPGIMLYGYGGNGLRPVLSLKSRIIMIKKVPAGTPISYGRTFITGRKSTIATIPAGYADGYNRQLSNLGEVIICGRRAPVAGRVCMDTIMADITDIPAAGVDSEVVLIGRQGRETITAADIAYRTNTIAYEVLTSIGQRVKRVYL